jgi:ABC-type dipeptide/oligopeptide/nickel transport system permease component
MGRFLARRLMGGALVILFASLIVFCLIDSIPGDAALVIGGESASQDGLSKIRSELNLDIPILLRYFRYASYILLRGDFGVSIISKRPVAGLIAEKLGNTISLTIVSTLLALLLGLGIGVTAARYHRCLPSFFITSCISILLAIPSFLLAAIFIGVFALYLRWLPVVGGGSIKHMVLPVLTLALPMTAAIARLSQANLIEASEKLYVLTARAKGVIPGRVWSKHIFRNALIPTLNYTGIHLGHLIGGAFVVETIFGYPGLGRLTIQSIFEHDYPVTMAAVLLVGVLFQVITFMVDIISGWLDPRISDRAI